MKSLQTLNWDTRNGDTQSHFSDRRCSDTHMQETYNCETMAPLCASVCALMHIYVCCIPAGGPHRTTERGAEQGERREKLLSVGEGRDHQLLEDHRARAGGGQGRAEEARQGHRGGRGAPPTGAQGESSKWDSWRHQNTTRMLQETPSGGIATFHV